MKTIYVFINAGRDTENIEGIAVAKDGTVLTGHLSSTFGWFRHDMGLSSDWKHEIYRKHYPDGYELVYVDDPRNHEAIQALRARALANSAAEQDKQAQSGGFDGYGEATVENR